MCPICQGARVLNKCVAGRLIKFMMFIYSVCVLQVNIEYVPILLVALFKELGTNVRVRPAV